MFYRKSLKLVLSLAMALSLLPGNSTLPGRAFAQTSLPDVRATIEAFDDQSLTGVIPNGSSSPRPARSYVRFTVKNIGTAEAKNFTFKAVVRLNGAKVFDPPAETISLIPGRSKTFVATIIHNTPGSKTVEAKLLADIGNFVKESNETNNLAEYKYTVQNVF